jgi:hypothetical protein
MQEWTSEIAKICTRLSARTGKTPGNLTSAHVEFMFRLGSYTILTHSLANASQAINR